MNVLILGGTGAIGAHLVSILGQSKHQIYVTSRREHESRGNVSYIQGNAFEILFLERLFSERHYGVIVDFMFYATEEFRMRIISFLDNTDQYFCISSSRVYADSRVAITEKSPRLTEVVKDQTYFESNEYSQSKCLLEDILTSTGRKNWTIIRPYITYSENRLQLGVYELKDWFYRIQKGRTIQLAQNIAKAQTTLTYGYDVAQGIAALVGQKEALGEIFHITQSETITWGRILEIYVDEIIKKTSVKPNVIITKKDIYSSIALRDMQVDYDRTLNRKFDNSKIKRFIDTSSFMPPEEGLRRCIRIWMENPIELYPDWWRQVLIDRLTGDEATPDEFDNDKDYQNYCHIRNDKVLLFRQRCYNLKYFIKKMLKTVIIR